MSDVTHRGLVILSKCNGTYIAKEMAAREMDDALGKIVSCKQVEIS